MWCSTPEGIGAARTGPRRLQEAHGHVVLNARRHRSGENVDLEEVAGTLDRVLNARRHRSGENWDYDDDGALSYAVCSTPEGAQHRPGGS